MSDPIRILWPRNQVPVTILVDDPTPCRNPMWYEFPDAGYEAVIPLAFTERFAAMCERTGAAGKFSIVPCPGAQGRVDQTLPGVAPDDLEQFLTLVRRRIAPRWSIGPEMLTHGKAIDLETGRVLSAREDAWAADQDERTLTRYISHALSILRNAGLEPTGVTSPWSFGIAVEDAYTGAIARALHDVCGVRLGWYFLHSDTTSPYVAPRAARLDPEGATALISIVSGQRDFLWQTQFGEQVKVDSVLTPDGSAGRLAGLFTAGSPIVFTTHWQSLFSNGSGAGLDLLEILCERINHAWGNRVRWTSADELARYCAARAAVLIKPAVGGRSVQLTSAFGCPDFTCALPVPDGECELLLDGKRLECCADGHAMLAEGCWSRAGDEARVCFRLDGRAGLAWKCA